MLCFISDSDQHLMSEDKKAPIGAFYLLVFTFIAQSYKS
jgi:hypothetical protein